MNGLLGRTALAVDGDARDRFREPGREPARASDVAGLRTERVDAAEDHVVDRDRVDPGPLDEGPDHVRAKVCRMRAGQAAVLAPDGRADRVDDEGLHHVYIRTRSSSGP